MVDRKRIDIVCDVIIEFQTTDPENDINIARTVLTEFENQFKLSAGSSYQLEEAKSISMGWSFAKLFLSLELAQNLYQNNSYEVDTFDARGRSYKFLAWFNALLKKKGCKAELKFSDDMKNTSGGSKYSSGIVAIFSDEFHWSR